MGYRELGLIATILMLGGFAYLLLKWRGKNSMSISLHAASARSAYYFFAAVQLLAGSLLAIFMFQWFIPQLSLDLPFRILFLFTCLCFYITILIPETKGLHKRLHVFFAFTLAFMLFVDTLYILTACSLSFATQIIGGATLAYMVFCAVAYVIVRKNPKNLIMRNYLRFQVLYLVCFLLFILAATYLQ